MKDHEFGWYTGVAAGLGLGYAFHGDRWGWVLAVGAVALHLIALVARERQQSRLRGDG